MLYENLINKLLDLGIEEDINTGDVTTESIIPESMNAVATMTAKQDGVISGLDIVKMVYDRFQQGVVFIPYFKDGDTVKKGVCSLLISSIALAEKESGKTLTKDEELTYVQKELKQTKETLETIPASRPELIEETKKKIAIIESYLPAQMSEEEVRKAIEEVMAEANLEPIRKNQGPIMKTMMAKYKGQTDGKTVNRILGTILK